MPDSGALQSPSLVTELKVSGHLMVLDSGVFCIFHTPGGVPPDPQTGLPGARVSLPPGPLGRGVTIRTFGEDGWLGAHDSAAIIRVAQGPAQILVTVYQQPGSAHEPPKLQVMRLTDAAQLPEPAAPAPMPPAQPALAAEADADTPPGAAGAALVDPEITAHVQQRGDVAAMLGDWVGEPGSQRWIEGFALSPRLALTLDDLEYQAVLGRGWLSPWSEGGQYCGSRGMALPILGLRVRLRGDLADTHAVVLNASFTDGTAIGPVGAGEPCEAASLAPLEAFQVMVVPIADGEAPAAKPRAKPAKGRRA